MAERKCKDWISSYLEYARNTEPPVAYHIFTALSTIGACLQRRVWLPWGHMDIYPNLYICLVGPPGGRKGTAMKIGKRMLEEIGVTLASDCITREALIEELQRSMTSPDDNATAEEQSEFAKQCALSVFSEEFAVFIGDSNPNMVITLTDLFDCPASWKYTTKNKGKNNLTNVWVNLIGAITPSLLQNRLTSDAVGGGLISRIIFVVEKGKAKRVPLPFLSDKEIALGEKLQHDLFQLLQLEGHFQMAKDAYQTYIQWYTSPTFTQAVPDDKFMGYNERRSLHLRKLAMICSASRSDEMVVRVEDLNRALGLLEAVEAKMPAAFHGIGRAAHSEVLADVMSFIAQAGKCTKVDLLHHFLRDVQDVNHLDGMIESLRQTGYCDVQINVNQKGQTETVVSYVSSEEEHE